MKKIITIVLILIAIAAAVGYYLYNKPVDTLEGQDAEASYQSIELFQRFVTDEVGMTEKLEGKVVEVSGTVVQTMENEDMSITIILDGDDPIFGIKCRLDPSVDGNSIPGKGEPVRLKGMLIGMNADVELNQCIIL